MKPIKLGQDFLGEEKTTLNYTLILFIYYVAASGPLQFIAMFKFI